MQMFEALFFLLVTFRLHSYLKNQADKILGHSAGEKYSVSGKQLFNVVLARLKLNL